MLRLYYYVLYKAFRFRKALPQSKSQLYLDTALLAALPWFAASVLGGLALLKRATSHGFPADGFAYKLAFAVLTFGPFLAIGLLNYRLVRSAAWRNAATEFQAHRLGRRLLGSLLVFLLCLALCCLPIAAAIHLQKP